MSEIPRQGSHAAEGLSCRREFRLFGGAKNLALDSDVCYGFFVPARMCWFCTDLEGARQLHPSLISGAEGKYAALLVFRGVTEP